jgi:predicted LPLAT superfamily acyltransferase
MSAASEWARQRERGSAWLVRVMMAISFGLGWHAGRALLLPITAWFLATSPRARVASREFLGRALGRPARARDVARHFYVFASAIMDRLFLVTGRTHRFRIRTAGIEHVQAVLAGGRGCILLGAHLGSFEVLRSVASYAPVPVRPLMYRRNAGALTRILDRLDPELRESIIEIGNPDSMLRAREAVERGEIVGLLADRAPASHRAVEALFLGRPAPFPAGPFVLAAALGVPVVLFHAVRVGPRRYQVQFEPFANYVTLRRGASRAADLQAWAACYAEALERACRAHPFNWFNFFPFWDRTSDAPVAPPRGIAALGAGPARRPGDPWPGRPAVP